MLFLIRILSCLPLSVLYGFADFFLYPVMYYGVRYRLSLVRKNLSLSFPEKSDRERKQLERQFYHHLADTIVEIIHGYRISEEEMYHRLVCDEESIALINRLAQQNGGIFIMMGHLGNWEWMADFARRFDPDILHFNVYRQLKHPSADRAMLALRAKRGGQCIEKNSLLRRLVSLRHAGHPISIGTVSDQKPSPRSAQIWTTFLHQETGFLEGTEVLARKFGYAVVYAHITAIKRGCYECAFEQITDAPNATQPGEITMAFARKLEANILEQPAQWLWTHNRWKWAKPDSQPLLS